MFEHGYCFRHWHVVFVDVRNFKTFRKILYIRYWQTLTTITRMCFQKNCIKIFKLISFANLETSHCASFFFRISNFKSSIFRQEIKPFGSLQQGLAALKLHRIFYINLDSSGTLDVGQDVRQKRFKEPKEHVLLFCFVPFAEQKMSCLQVVNDAIFVRQCVLG